ncbi:MAG: hypothetical protein QOK33_3281 [Mycobacterium sp.]|jgi:hypothetical protein|nr:hypothetical protein [Mycobacterium sp.]
MAYVRAHDTKANARGRVVKRYEVVYQAKVRTDDGRTVTRLRQETHPTKTAAEAAIEQLAVVLGAALLELAQRHASLLGVEPIASPFARAAQLNARKHRRAIDPAERRARGNRSFDGSNPDPAKLLRRRGFFGGDSVIALRRAVFGWPLPGATLAAQTDRWSPFKALSAAPGGGMTTAGRRRIRARSQ